MAKGNADVIIAFRIWATWAYPDQAFYNITHMMAFKCFLGQKHEAKDGRIIDYDDPEIAARVDRIVNSGRYTETILQMMKIKFDEGQDAKDKPI